jgi:hypothetical protein
MNTTKIPLPQEPVMENEEKDQTEMPALDCLNWVDNYHSVIKQIRKHD